MDTTSLDDRIADAPTERRAIVGQSKLDRLVAGLLGAAADLELDSGVDLRPLVAERLRRIAAEAEGLGARDLVRPVARVAS